MRGFVIRFVLFFIGLNWLFGQGSVPALGRLIGGLARLQIDAAAGLLGLFGSHVVREGNSLVGPRFSCGVGEGCNGMIPLALVLAGCLAFPVPWRRRWVGLLALPLLVLGINVARIVGLYGTGVVVPKLFNAVHVYVGQIVVIAFSAAFWWVWLSWASRESAAASAPSASSSSST